MRKTTNSILAGLLVASAALSGCSRQDAAAEPVRSVRTMIVSSESAGGTLEYAAEVRARTESRLGFRVGGKITRRQAELGDSVKAGQVLAQLDPQDLRLAQDAARAALNAAQTNLELATADYKRYRDLRDQGFISSAELERRDTALKSAQAQFDQARAQASVQGNQAAYSSLVADASGVITGIDAEPGMVVASGTPVLRLAHDGPRDAVFSIPEDRIVEVRTLAGKQGGLKVRLWGSDRTYDASVRELAAAADPMTRTFLVKADVGSAPVKLGQSATVVMDLPRVSGVMRLPLTAVAEVQGRTSVWVVEKDKGSGADASLTVRPQPIEVAGADGNTVVVSAGLNPGQMVVTAGAHVLTPGQRVKLYRAPGPAVASATTH
jgi:RND family efflux transporter MFP subunit